MAKFSWIEKLENDINRLSRKEGDVSHAIMKLRGGERRHVAIFFLDIKGFTAMSEKLDSEVVQLIIDHCFKIFSADIEDFGGEVEKYMGDAIMACFGAHSSHENDAERAVRAGIRILERLKHINQVIAKLDLKIGMRIGINYGLVTTGRVGLGRDRDFTVMGDVVNTSQRLESNAPVNSLMITRELKELLGDIFVYKDLDPVQVKGKKEPLQVCNVIGLKSRRTERWERSMLAEHADFIGRQTELAQLVDLYQKARENDGRTSCIARIEAPAGGGKSRLVHEFLGTQVPPQHAHHLHANTSSYIQSPYDLFADLLRRTLDFSGENSEEFRTKLQIFLENATKSHQKQVREASPFLAYILDIHLDDARIEAMDPKARQLEIQLALSAFVKCAAEINAGRFDRRFPLLIILDDLHWLDPLSLAALNFIVEQLRERSSIFWLLITRPGPPLPEKFPGFQVDVKLLPFDISQTEKMISSMLPGLSFSENDLKILHEKTTGLPFFIEETINTFIKADVVKKTASGWILNKKLDAAKIPDSLGGLVKSRIDQLDERSREILSQGSVIGKDFEKDLLLKLNQSLELKTDDLDENMQTIQNNDLAIIKDESHYSFKSLIIQEVAYNAILLRNRSVLHRLVAEYLENRFGDNIRMSPLFFHHYSKTEDYEKLFHYLGRALDLANQNYDLETGIQLTNSGIKLLEQMEGNRLNQERRFHVLNRRIYINNLLGNRQQQNEDIQWCLDFSSKYDNTEWKAEAIIHLAEFNVVTGDFSKAFEVIEELSDQLDDIKITSRERFYRLRGLIFDRLSHFNESLSAYQEALKINQMQNRKNAEIQIYLNMGLLYANRSQFEKALEHYQQALELNQEVGDRRNRGMILNNMGIVQKNNGNYSEALQAYKKVYEIFETIGDKNFMAFSLGNLGITQRLIGLYQEALGSMELAQDLFEKVNNPVGKAMTQQEIGAVFIDIDEEDLALKNLEEALAQGEKAGFKPMVMDCLLFLSRLELKTKNIDAALEKAEKGLKIALEIHDKKHEMSLLSQKAFCLLAKGDLPQARVLSQQAMDFLEDMPGSEDAEMFLFTHHLILKASFDPEAVIPLENAKKIIEKTAAKLERNDRQRFFQKPLNKILLA
jgi:class 3 adenylate cyclase/predicted ATPase